MTLPTTYTAQEVADSLRASAYWVRKQVRQGVVQPMRVGRDYRFTDADVAQLYAALRPPPPPPVQQRRRKRRTF